VQGAEPDHQELVEFAAAASHDLATPLRVISGYTDLLADRVGAADPEATSAIEAIRRGVDRMQTLVNGLLAYARTGDELAVESVDSDEVVAETLAALEDDISSGGIEITVDELPVVFANRGQLHQVFQNLISNAIKFRADENPRIDITCVEEPGVWHYTVADNGLGIRRQDVVRIFDLFGRSRATAEREGSGIGLAVAKRVVEGHGGGIWVESEPGDGASFHFTLPRQLRRTDDPRVNPEGD
jgi:two-component system, chemotaxis family, sensor kinase Cph1